MEYSVKTKILDAAEPYLVGKRIKDLVIGISLIGCQLDDGSVGVAYVLRDELPPQCSAFSFAEKLLGAPAEEAAKLFVYGEDNIRRAVGNAVITAAVSADTEIKGDDGADAFGIEPMADDTVGMIGFIKPVAAQLRPKVERLVIFDTGISRGSTSEGVFADELQGELLPKCNKLIITGSSTINGSIDGLLELGKNAEKIAIVGSSTPMLKPAWRGTPVTALAGTCWKAERKADIFRSISLGGGISGLKGCSVKKLVKMDK